VSRANEVFNFTNLDQRPWEMDQHGAAHVAGNIKGAIGGAAKELEKLVRDLGIDA